MMSVIRFSRKGLIAAGACLPPRAHFCLYIQAYDLQIVFTVLEEKALV